MRQLLAAFRSGAMVEFLTHIPKVLNYLSGLCDRYPDEVIPVLQGYLDVLLTVIETCNKLDVDLRTGAVCFVVDGTPCLVSGLDLLFGMCRLRSEIHDAVVAGNGVKVLLTTLTQHQV